MYILTSIGLSYEPVRLLVANKHNIADFRVAIITTAAAWKEENKYAKLAYQQFSDLWVKEVFFFDIEKDSLIKLENIDCIYVCGGNTFYLAAEIKKTNFDTYVKEHIKQWGLYIGVSAWSIVVWPDIWIAAIVGDENNIHLIDYSWMWLVDIAICPHYTAELEPDLEKYQQRIPAKIIRLGNDSAIIVEADSNNIEYM